MPAIWNINSAYNINNKKVSSKLTFEVGEKFTGRIISKGNGNDAIIKLTDGWQFEAEIEGELPLDSQGLIKFEVEGFEDGKLKLRIVNRELAGQSLPGDSISEVIEKEGFSKEDISFLREMVKHDMPLTKENITFIKGLIQFNQKINNNPEEINKFIEKFLNVKGITSYSEEGQIFTKSLNDFMKVFKDMSPKELFLFLENDIELNKENIDSFNKLFKSEKSLHEYFNGIGNELKNLDIENDLINKPIENIKDDKIKVDITNKDIDNINKELISQTSGKIASKVYDANDLSKGKISMLSILKSMAGGSDEVIKEQFKNILLDRVSNFTTSEFNKINNTINNLNDDSFVDIFKNMLNEDGTKISKEDVELAVSKFMGKEIKLSDTEFEKIIDLVKLKIGENIKKEGLPIDEFEETKLLKNTIEQDKDLNMSSKDIIRDDIKTKLDSIKDVVRDILKHVENNSKMPEKVMELLKNSINDFRLLNSINNEYYYVDIPVRKDDIDYPCKLIIKDNRKDGKIIDKTNVKLVVSIKTSNIGIVDGYLKFKDNRLDVDLKCEEKFVKPLNSGKVALLEGLKTLGFITNIIVSKRTEEVNLITCREFFNDNNTTAIDIKV